MTDKETIIEHIKTQELQDRLLRFDDLFKRNAKKSFLDSPLFRTEEAVTKEADKIICRFKTKEEFDKFCGNDSYFEILNKLNKNGIIDFEKLLQPQLGTIFTLVNEYFTDKSRVKFTKGTFHKIIGFDGYYDNREDFNEWAEKNILLDKPVKVEIINENGDNIGFQKIFQKSTAINFGNLFYAETVTKSSIQTDYILRIIEQNEKFAIFQTKDAVYRVTNV